MSEQGRQWRIEALAAETVSDRWSVVEGVQWSREMLSWGARGWDASSEWPLVRYTLLAYPDGVEVVTETEGDVSRHSFSDAQHGGRVGAVGAACDLLDTLIGWHWGRGYGTPNEYDAAQPSERHRGPYVG